MNQQQAADFIAGVDVTGNYVDSVLTALAKMAHVASRLEELDGPSAAQLAELSSEVLGIHLSATQLQCDWDDLFWLQKKPTKSKIFECIREIRLSIPDGPIGHVFKLNGFSPMTVFHNGTFVPSGDTQMRLCVRGETYVLEKLKSMVVWS